MSLFKNILLFMSAVKNSFSTYVYCTPDGLFWLNLCLLIIKDGLMPRGIRLEIVKKSHFKDPYLYFVM